MALWLFVVLAVAPVDRALPAQTSRPAPACPALSSGHALEILQWHMVFGGLWPARTCASGDERSLLLLGLGRILRAQRGGQLQHSRALPLAQSRHQDDLAVWKLQRIVMHRRLVYIDLTKTRDPVADLLLWQDRECRLARHIALQGDLRAWQQAHGDIRLSDGGKAARDRMEFGGDQLVFDLGRPARDMVKTVITHRRLSFIAANSRD